MKKILHNSFRFLSLVFVAVLVSCGGSGKPGSDESSLPKKDTVLPKAKADTMLVIKGTNVNMRVSPDLKAVRIKQLTTNDTCKILEKGKQETINEATDFWYKVRFKSKEGWIFGAFTSLKMPEKPVVEEKKHWYKK